MPKKYSAPRTKRRPRRTNLKRSEDRKSIAVTVAWMLSVLCTLTAEIAAVLVQIVAVWLDIPDTLGLLADYLLASAVICGIVTLVLTPITLKIRDVRPPQAIVNTAIVVGAVPLVALVARSLT